MCWLWRRGVFVLVLAKWIFRFANDAGPFLGDDLFALRELLVQLGDALQAWSVLVLGRPAPEQLRALLLHIRVRQIRRAADT